MYMSHVSEYIIPIQIKWCGTSQLERELHDYYATAYRNLRDSFGLNKCDDKEKYCNDIYLSSTRESVISKVISPLLPIIKEHYDEPNLFFDCYSTAVFNGAAPTYQLMEKVGLKTCIPVAVENLGGVEFPYALQLLLKKTDLALNNSIICTSQIIEEPDLRQNSENYTLGDAVAGVVVTSDKGIINDGYEIRAVIIRQLKDWGELDVALMSMFKEYQKLNLPNEWNIIHSYNKDLYKRISSLYPNSRLLIRRENTNVNFGSCDTLVTLSLFEKEFPSKCRGNGSLWVIGRFNTVAQIVLSSYIN